MLGTYIQSYRA